jgi:pimeloyl-ACP methyl ester carboxylesterase
VPRHHVDPIHHSEGRLGSHDPPGWRLYFAHATASRLVVFVHGFWGGPIGTWVQFPDSGRYDSWWASSDLLFVGYNSKKDTIAYVSQQLCTHLPRFFPTVPEDLMTIGNVSIRTPTAASYDELILVGHSLGGMVIRRALCDAAWAWEDPSTRALTGTRHPILGARVRLFSPATAGIRLAGIPAMVWHALSGGPLSLVVKRSPAFSELQESSPMVVSTKEETRELRTRHAAAMDALRADVVWAYRDEFVNDMAYPGESSHYILGRDHRSVCKPSAVYGAPREFVKSGTVP